MEYHRWFSHRDPLRMKMSRTAAKVVLGFSVASFFFLVIFDGSILDGLFRSVTQIFEFLSLIGIGSLLKAKILKSNSSLWIVALFVTVLTSIQALVALPLHTIEVHFVSATPSAFDWERLEVHLPHQEAKLYYDSSKSSPNEWVFTGEGRLLKWGKSAVATTRIKGSIYVDTIPISWPLESLFKLFSPRVMRTVLPGDKSLIRITPIPAHTQLRIVYRSRTAKTILDTFSEGLTVLSIRVGGQLQIQANADGYVGERFDYDVDTAMAIEIALKPMKVAVTIEVRDLSGIEARDAKIYIDSEITGYRPFEEFHLESNESYWVIVKRTVADGRKTESEPRLLRLFPGVDTSISCTLRPLY